VDKLNAVCAYALAIASWKEYAWVKPRMAVETAEEESQQPKKP
jgi:hypothetical protein